MDELETARSEAVLLTSDGARKRFWIEWKNYDDADTHADALSKVDVVDRVRKLARLLNHIPKPEAFRTPHCLGFFDKADPHVAADEVDVLDRRLGLIFDWPENGGDGTPLPPVSLHDLLVRADIRRKPRVTDRVRLAHALSSCMLYLHAVNWLQKGLRSHNVVFFLDAPLSMPEDVSDERTDLAQPVLSGFDFSRPVGADEMTDAPGDDAEHNLYRHPQTQSNRRRERERSKKSFDIYGLGVVLVEMAHWRPVDAVLGIDMHKARGNPDVIRQARERLLAPSSMADVGAEMGQRYEEATRTCLIGGAALGLQPGDDETADEVAERLSVHYYEGVVKNIGGIII